MADEILEETQTEEIPETTPSEGTTEGTQTEEIPETTPSEGTTEGTQTEGTTGNGYLTKPYLVRNLQTFWGKIKQYIKNSTSGFVNQDTVNGSIALAVSDKATKEDLASLETEVNSLADTVATKANQNALTAVETELNNKVDKDGDKVLSTYDFDQEYKDKLDNLKNATTAEDGLMSADDKQKLDELVEKVVTEVDEALSTTSTNPVQNAAISAALNGKVDKENPEDPSELTTNITSYATNEGHIVLNFIRDTEHLRIYTPNSDRPIEKVSFKDQNEVLFTNFQKNDDGTLAVIIENPEGKTETEDESGNSKTTWKITPGESFNFYVEDFVLDNSKYKSFILEATRDDMGGSQVLLNIVKIFES